MSTWVNNDGLRVRFGTDKSKPADGGFLSTKGDLNDLVVKLDYTDIKNTPTVLTEDFGVPSGAFIDSVTLYVKDAWTSGGAATLDIGLYYDNGDGTYTAFDADGLVAAQAVAGLTADTKVVGAGALVGTKVVDATLGRKLLITSNYNTIEFTAGSLELVIKYRV